MEQCKHLPFISHAIALAKSSMDQNLGGPFGCVIVKDGKIIAEGTNQVTSTNDPSAHAEIVAIREACKNLNDFQLKDCTIYTTCEPCPMCMGAIYWARPDAVVYAANRHDAAHAGFDDSLIYQELTLPDKDRKIPFINAGRNEALTLFEQWIVKEDKITY